MSKYGWTLMFLSIIAIIGYGFCKIHNLNDAVIQLQQQNSELEHRLDLVSETLATNVELVDRLELIVNKNGVNQ